MPQFPIQKRTKIWQVTAADTDETTAIFSVKAGERVLWASVLPLVSASASTSSTIIVGDGTDNDGYLTSTAWDPEAAALGTYISGDGALFALSGGKLYTVDDTIDVIYSAVAAGDTGGIEKRPKARIAIGVVRAA